MKSNKIALLAVFFAANSLLGSCNSKLSEAPPNIMENFPERSIGDEIYLEGENVGGKRVSEVKGKIEELSYKVNLEPKDAVFDKRSWEIISREKTGKKINVEKTLESLLNARTGDKVKLVVEEIKPGISSEKAAGNVVEIAGFSTRLLDRQASRVNNIAVAAKKLNYRIVSPGEEFSFNAALGRRTEAKGYEEAPVIVKTEDGYEKGIGVGGGICQLSSTLYNAVEKCGMTVTERHIHSKSVGYVPRGRDATVAYGSADFKFINNRNYPVMIRTGLGRNTLTVRIIENRSGL